MSSFARALADALRPAPTRPKSISAGADFDAWCSWFSWHTTSSADAVRRRADIAKTEAKLRKKRGYAELVDVKAERAKLMKQMDDLAAGIALDPHHETPGDTVENLLRQLDRDRLRDLAIRMEKLERVRKLDSTERDKLALARSILREQRDEQAQLAADTAARKEFKRQQAEEKAKDRLKLLPRQGVDHPDASGIDITADVGDGILGDL